MAADAEMMLLAAVGIGIIVTGVMLIMTLKDQKEAKQEVVVQQPEGWGWGWAGGWLPNWGPYYSHLPVRPLLY